MSVKTVLFDLDGTLLPMDQDVFVKYYFGKLAAKLAKRTYFAHLRQLKYTNDVDFYENGHITERGDVDIYAIVKALVDAGFDGYVRPDHGRMIWGESGKPGYGLFDRALGATYLYGVFEAVEKGAKK